LLAACSEVGIPASRSIMIGDTSYDMEMGKAAGFATLGVSWGYHDLERLSGHADHIVDAYDQVDGALKEMCGELK